MADSDLSKWASISMAALAAVGGYVGSVSSKSAQEGAATQKIETLEITLKDHDNRERTFEEFIRAKVSDIDARVRVLESRPR